MKKLRHHLTFANVVSCIALLVALGGTSAWAATTLNGRVLAARSVPGNKLKVNSVTGAEVNENRLGSVRRAQRASRADFATRATTADSARSATTATTAITATSASRATIAATATRSTSATSASRATRSGDADKLGGVAAARYLTSGTFVTRHPGPWGIFTTTNGTMQPDQAGTTVLHNAAVPASDTRQAILTLPSPQLVAGRPVTLVSARACVRGVAVLGTAVTQTRLMSVNPIANALTVHASVSPVRSNGYSGCVDLVPDTPVALTSDRSFVVDHSYVLAPNGFITFTSVDATWSVA